MNKLFFLFLTALLVVPFSLGECVQGIDDVCDPACIDVDFDCIENEAGQVQDFICVSEQDGRCDPRCQEVDYDCLAQNIQERIEEVQEIRQVPQTQEQTALFSFEERDPSTLEISLIIVGFFLLALSLIWILRRIEDKQTQKTYAPLIPYGQQALAQGFNKSQIEKQLESQGYSPKFIKGYFKALERRP